MNAHDIIEVPWQPGNYARRVLVEALDRAGRPHGNSFGRLRSVQQEAYDKYRAGLGSPADDPNRPDAFPLAHVRFVAADIDPTPDRVRRLTAAGLVRPYKHEPWHWQVPNVYLYPLVDSIPALAASTPTPILEEDMNIVLYLYTPTNTLLLVDHLNKRIRDLGNSAASPTRDHYSKQPYTRVADKGMGLPDWAELTRGYTYI